MVTIDAITEDKLVMFFYMLDIYIELKIEYMLLTSTPEEDGHRPACVKERKEIEEKQRKIIDFIKE